MGSISTYVDVNTGIYKKPTCNFTPIKKCNCDCNCTNVKPSGVFKPGKLEGPKPSGTFRSGEHPVRKIEEEPIQQQPGELVVEPGELNVDTDGTTLFGTSASVFDGSANEADTLAVGETSVPVVVPAVTDEISVVMSEPTSTEIKVVNAEVGAIADDPLSDTTETTVAEKPTKKTTTTKKPAAKKTTSKKTTKKSDD